LNQRVPVSRPTVLALVLALYPVQMCLYQPVDFYFYFEEVRVRNCSLIRESLGLLGWVWGKAKLAMKANVEREPNLCINF
jgi:hypothetical protein